MSAPDSAPLLEAQKEAIRRAAHAARRAQPDKEATSRRILDRVFSSDQYQSASRVMFYIDVRDEVRTRPVLAAALDCGTQVVVPYCVERSLQLFRLESVDELAAGAYGIPEPRAELRTRAEKSVDVASIDLVLVPGLAFDSRGGRIGYGKGYYDKLLAAARPDTPLVAPAYDCQIFPSVPMEPHDIYMDFIVTESTTHLGRGRRK